MSDYKIFIEPRRTHRVAVRQRLLRLKTSNSRGARGTRGSGRRWRDLPESPEGLALCMGDIGISENCRKDRS